MSSTTPKGASTRTAEHRRRMAAQGYRRVDLTVPDGDLELIRQLAAELRAGGEQAERLRNHVRSAVGRKPAQTGDELLEFFRQSPLVDEDLSFERDRSPGRPIDL